MPGPLDGVKIVDLTAVVSGPFATAMLGDLGADVIKVEQPGGGDVARRFGAVRGGISSGFAVMNRNKRAVALDLQSKDGVELFLQLVKDADLVLQNFRPGVVDRLGVGYTACQAVNPDIIYISISGFGDTGPYAADRVYDHVIQAVTGFMGVQTDPQTRQPAPVRNIVCDKVTSMTVVQGALAALFAREKGAGGQHVSITMVDAGLAFLWPDAMSNHTYLGDDVPKVPDLGDTANVTATADGFITWYVTSDDEYQGLCRALDMAELSTDPRFEKLASRVPNMPELNAIANARIANYSTADILARFTKEQVAGAKINLRTDIADDPQIRHNNAIIEAEHPQAGKLRYPAPPIRFSRTPADIRRHAPQLGGDTDAVLAELGISAEQCAAMRARGIIA
jgi:crotonobetainyl-CoA:carnitine CoA-transferase CaiB-like acyl-CoA transferase